MTTQAYNPRAVVKDGPFTAERRWQHILKVMTAIVIYAILRDVVHLTPTLAAIAASPAFMVVATAINWWWPSDPNEHSYSLALRIDDFLTDLSCSLAAVVVGACALGLWLDAAVVLVCAFITYRLCRRNARP